MLNSTHKKLEAEKMMTKMEKRCTNCVGKTMENFRKRIDVKLVSNKRD